VVTVTLKPTTTTRPFTNPSGFGSPSSISTTLKPIVYDTTSTTTAKVTTISPLILQCSVKTGSCNKLGF
jgi:hypothetical protein